MNALTLSVLLSLGADAIDLGVISPHRGLILERNTSRPDWSHYKAEFLSLPSSNLFRLDCYSDMINIESLGPVPSGPAILGVRSVTTDGQESQVSLYKLDIRRAEPPAPTVRAIQILQPRNAPQSLTNAIQRFRDDRIMQIPPRPARRVESEVQGGMVLSDSFGTNLIAAPDLHQMPQPMPEATNQTYGQKLDAMADFYNKPGRRNQ